MQECSFLTSCEDYFGDVNVDPDNPIVVTPEVALPQIQLRLSYTLGGDASRLAGIYSNQIDGFGRCAYLSSYLIQFYDTDDLWANLYTGVLMDNRRMTEDAVSKAYYHYEGIGKIIEAYTIMLLTDLFGDIPYSEAFKGVEGANPIFDHQANIYDEIFILLDEARRALSKNDGGYPVRGDLIYNGNNTDWIKLANVLEARAWGHLAKINPSNYQKVIDALEKGGFESSEDDPLLHFGSAPSEQSPWYQYIAARNDMQVGRYYVELLDNMNDPRIATYGAPHTINHPIFTPSQPVNLLSFTEQEFIAAEAYFFQNDKESSHFHYLNGIKSSFKEAKVIDSLNTFIARADIDPGPNQLTLSDIIVQKYIALFTQVETFSDWRRTALPELEPRVGTEIPRRLPYAQTEVLYNPNTPSSSEVDIYTPVWWDN